MKEVLSLYYRKCVPYRVRHGLRHFVYRMRYVFSNDRFVTIDSAIVRTKIDEIILDEIIHWIYTAPQTMRYGVLASQKIEQVEITDRNKVVKFKNVSCFGASDIIRIDKHHYLYEVRDYYRAQNKNGIATNDGNALLIEDPGYYIINHSLKREHIEKGILLSSYFADNYYHFTYQCLAKLRLCHKIDKDVPLLVNSVIDRYPSLRQMLDICNTDHRKVIKINHGSEYDIDKLYYISPQMISVPCYREGSIKMSDDDLYSKESLDYLRAMLLPHEDKVFDVPPYVFLERRYASKRRSYNEEECYEALKKIGFVGIRPEALSLTQQIALFHRAKCIVGATGAAFTNLIYSSSDCTYVILKGAESEESIFSSIAFHNKSKLVYICDQTKGRMTDASQEHGDFHIDAKDLIRNIKSLLE